MRRLLSGIAAFALALGLASPARAALITFDVSDTGGSTSINALGVSTIPFAPGSLITVETDRNGNGNANDWRIVSATLNVAGDLDLSSYGLGSLTYDYSLSLGPTNGTRIGSWVIWGSNPTIPITYSGSVRCAGPICDFFQTETGAPWEPGVDYSYALYLANELGAGNTFLNPIALGEWWLDASGTAIASAPRVDLAVQTSNPFVATQFLALVTNSYVGVEIPYEPPDPELPLPEPGVTALLLVACAGLALRRRFRVEKGFQVAALAVSGVFALAAAAHSAQVTYDLGGHGYYENVGTGIGTLSFSSSVTPRSR